MVTGELVPLHYGFVYWWTHTPSGRHYIGSHDGSKSRTYVGSGSHFKTAYRKYPRAEWTRTILYGGPSFRNLEELFLRALWVDVRGEFFNLSLGTRNPVLRGENSPSYGKPKSKEQREKIAESLRGYVFTDEHRESISAANSGPGNGNYRKPRSEETKQKIRSNRPDTRGVNHPMYGKKLSEETKEKIRQKAKDRPKRGPMSEEQRVAISAANSGKVRTPEQKKLMGRNRAKVPKITCPHCNFTGDPAGLTRWHFDNCKNRGIQ